MIVRLGILLAVISVAACGNAASGPSPKGRQGPDRIALRGATIGPGGYATILDVPPAPFTPAKPSTTQPPKPTQDQLARQQQWRRVAEFQNRVRLEVEALSEKLRSAEKGNFVDLYYENEGEPHVVFRFLRNGRQTLAKYTHNPRFVATEVRYSMEQLMAAMDFMLETFREDRVIQAGGIGSKTNRADVEINVPPEEFWALVARKHVKIPEAVNLQFRAERSASEVNRHLPPAIARYVRIFPRYDRPLGPIELIESRAKVVLKDGCFRLADLGNALALLPFGAQLFIDKEGYLAFGSGEVPGYARVGEEIVTPGVIHEVTSPDLVKPIHAACGPGKVLKLNGIGSATAAHAQGVATTNDNNFRQLRTFYGLSDVEARKVFDACKKQNSGTCLLSPPPPMRREDCPSGTTFSSGLCRTREGFIRPLPAWIDKLIGPR